jgi:uncharacterized protein YbjT (DUF2867 family)
MKITLTGAAGNITKPLAEKLLATGHHVTVIGRNAENLKPLTEKGAKVAIGSIEDAAFITKAFQGADVVYTMIPVPFHLDDWVAYHILVGNNYANAIKTNNIKKVVNLGTYGGHHTEGIGPTASLGKVEALLREIEGIDFTTLRPGYFYTNFLSQIPFIKQSGVIGGNYGDLSNELLLSHYTDIAEAAYKALITPHFNNNEPYYPISDIRTLNEAAYVLGNAVGLQSKQWIPFQDEDTFNGFIQAGFSEAIAKIYVEIGQFFAQGKLNEHYISLASKPTLYKVKLEDFAKEFAVVYNAN